MQIAFEKIFKKIFFSVQQDNFEKKSVIRSGFDLRVTFQE